MSFISFVVPAYRSEQYLAGCIESVRCQQFTDWELLVIDDGSPDRSSEIALSYQAQDSRIRLIAKEENGGIHRARKTGVMHARGSYLVFIDADDELHEGCLPQMVDCIQENPDADVFHFGINVIGVDVDKKEQLAFESYINSALDPADGKEILLSAYSKEKGYLQDWRLTQRLYKTDLLKQAFELMVDDRLGRNEDGYEYFVVSSIAKRQITRNDIVFLDYYYGRGLNGASSMRAGAFEKTAREFETCLKAMESYAESFDGFDLSDSLMGSRQKAIELLFNDWLHRVEDAEKKPAAQSVVSLFGEREVCYQLLRLARDAAYGVWCAGGMLNGSEPYIGWMKWAEDQFEPMMDSWRECRELHIEARNHISDLEMRSGWCPSSASPSLIKKLSYEGSGVRIFVTTHKDVDFFHSDILQPVQVGPRVDRKRLLWAYQDDEGDNISDLNPMYCELTPQYWAWKNKDAEYYGFCHYRRYFDFSDVEHTENAYGEVMYDRVCWDAQKEFKLDDASIRTAVEGYDLLTTGFKDLRDFPEHFQNPYDHYKRAPYLHIEDLDRMIQIVKDEQPEYAQDVDAFFSGNHACFCNMYIMRKELFFRYCEWLFPLLERFLDGWDTSKLSHQTLRTPGHLSERLFNIFVLHEKRVNPQIKTKELQCVHFEHPEHLLEPSLKAIDGNGREVIPVVLAADNNYVPMLTTTIFSMVKNASSEYVYDIVIFEKDISAQNKQLMSDYFADFPYASIRFANVAGLMRTYNLSTSNEHISVETYYRFLIQKILPFYDKVLYLDSDLIVCSDISELFKVDLGDNLLGAVLDIDYLGNLDIGDRERMRYSHDVLGLKDPFGYFQAGVLLLNIKELRDFITFEKWLKIASEPKYIYDDQDILNAQCQGRVLYLDDAWNVMVNCDNRFDRVYSFAPADVFDSFMKAYSDPKIVHYAGYEKPWKPGKCDMSELYWAYARQTPFYEKLLALKFPDLYQVCDRIAEAKEQTIHELTYHEPAISPESPLRKVFDGMLPLGSRRREFLKSAVRMIRGRK